MLATLKATHVAIYHNIRTYVHVTLYLQCAIHISVLYCIAVGSYCTTDTRMDVGEARISCDTCMGNL